MITITEGSVSVSLADDLAPPAKAGHMSKSDVNHLPKAHRGLGLACDLTADAMEKAGAKFTAPAGVTPASLRAAGKRAEDIDKAITDLSVVLETLKQANLLFDADAWEQLRKVNDLLNAQAKHDKSLSTIFQALVAYFARPARTAAPTQPTTPA